MERTTPREVSGIIDDDMSRTAQTVCFKSQEGSSPGNEMQIVKCFESFMGKQRTEGNERGY